MKNTSEADPNAAHSYMKLLIDDPLRLGRNDDNAAKQNLVVDQMPKPISKAISAWRGYDVVNRVMRFYLGANSDLHMKKVVA